jgi:membrane-bound lytic murein transglycosylase D
MAAALFCSLLALLPGALVAADESDFPVPASILPAIEFWKKVYTEADTDSGFLHDSQNLAVIYEKLPRDSKLIDARRKQIASDLRVLGSGKRSGLSTSQQRILALWGENASNTRLNDAANTIRWQLGQSDRYKEGLIRSGAYRQHIENVVRSKGMPIELAALPHVESSFHPGAYSSAAASGMWQFMRETARRFMRVDGVVDERLDPYRATWAAMDMLQADYRALGSWPLALTAYNHGANGMARAVRDTGSLDIGRIISDYKGPRFGFASRNFYPQFLAALEVERNAEQYFGKLQLDRYPDFAEYEMTAFVDVAAIAESLGVSVAELKRANPALQQVVWTGNKRIPKGYMLKVDRSTFGGDLVASLNALPASQFFTSQIPDLSYTVRSGDSLSVIASRYKTSVSELVAINQLRDRNSIRIGQTLILPQQNGAVPTLVVSNTGPQPVPDDGQYEVRRGDTLTTIASRYKVAPATLMALNGLRNQNLIYPGQKLRLAPEAAERIAAAPVAEQLQDVLEVQEQEANFGSAVEDVALVPVIAADAPAVAVDEAQAAREALAIAENVLAADPSDYSVAADNTIEILTDETLSHFADWLGMGAAELRRLNQLRTNVTVRVGDRFKLDFAKASKESFEAKRKQYHGNLQARYFASYRIRDTESYSIKRSEVVGNLARARSVPMWLFRQYNPEVTDASLVRAGQIVVFPVVEKVDN